MKLNIAKLLEGNISESELMELNDWLENPKNKAKLEAYIKDYHDINLTMLQNNLDVAFKSVKTQIEESKPEIKTIPIYKRSFVRYAAMVLIFMAIGFSYWNGNKSKASEPIIVNTDNNIEIGTDKALLTLEDGTNISLEKGTEYVSNNIKSNGEKIIYSTKEIEKPNIKHNELTISRGGQYHVELADGTEVWLNSESKLRYPTAFIDGEDRKVELIYGEAYFDVSPSSDHKGSKFMVINASQEIEVVGTEFNVKAYQDENIIYTTLAEGKVIVKAGGDRQNLVPGEQLRLDKISETILVKEVDVYNEVSWKDGVFSFEDKTLKEMMVVLERWYDVEIVINNKSIENHEFVGILRKNQKIEEILNNIKNFGVIKTFNIYDKKVVLN